MNTDTTNESMLPLAVDLDGTLLRTDTLWELLLSAARTNPWKTMQVLLGLPGASRAKFKSELAGIDEIDPSLLPYDSALLDYLQAEKRKGRRLVLATAAHRSIAEAVAEHLGLFDEVLATDGSVNLKGEAKAAALVERFGEGGFAYAGDSAADRAVWRRAGSALPVGDVERLSAGIGVAIERAFPRARVAPAVLLRQLRVYQWIKNVLVFVPATAAGTLFDYVNLVSGMIAFFAFCLVASGIYVVNDLLDVRADRTHPRKRTRPFASGDLPLQFGFVLAPVLIGAGLLLAAFSGPLLLAVLAGYVALTTWYSVHLKSQPLVDVFALAGLYSLRILGGGAATDIMPSTWLLSFSGCLFLSLAFLKRYVETDGRAAESGGRWERLPGRGYYQGESLILMLMGVAASFAAAVVFALWLDSAAFRQTYSHQFVLWLVTPLVLLWQCRLWLAAFRRNVHDDPIIYTAKDRISWIIFGTAGVLYVLGLTT